MTLRVIKVFRNLRHFKNTRFYVCIQRRRSVVKIGEGANSFFDPHFLLHLPSSPSPPLEVGPIKCSQGIRGAL